MIRMANKSPKTLMSYARLLLELTKFFDVPEGSLNFAKDTKKVISYVEGLDKSYASKKLYYAVLVSVLRDLKVGRTKLLREAEEIYRKKMVEYNLQLKEIAERQTMSEREIGIWNSWEEIMAAYGKLKLSAEANLADKKVWQEYAILSLYTLIAPLRSDYSPVRITTPDDNGTDNKLVIDTGSIVFVLQDYKTAKQYGVQRIAFPIELANIIRHWLTMETSGFLFNVKGKPASESWLSGQVRSLMKRLTGKASGINILRHSYISYMRRDEAPVLAQQALAASMMHSNGMSQLYRRL
jgi:hypothetical protein